MAKHNFDSFWRPALFAVATALLAILCSAQASAQRSSEAELRLIDFEPWLVKTSGPAKSKGVVYYIRGYGLRARSLDEFRIAPYFLKTLSENGWDVLEAKVPYGATDDRQFEAAPKAAPFVRRRVRELKAQGYRRVVVAGHGWGAWVAMLAAQDRRFSADALILHVPVGYGPPILPLKGIKNPRFQNNWIEFRPLVQALTIPTVLIVFAGDEYEVGERGAFAKKQFEQRNVPHLIFNKPRGFTGHSAGWIPVFDYAFGKCIQSFLERPKTEKCQPPALSNSDFRSVVAMAQLSGDKGAINDAQSLVGKKYVAYTLGAPYKHYDFLTPNQRNVMAGLREWSEPYLFRGNRHCARGTCSILVRWSDREILEFDPDTRNLRAWWIQME